MRKKRKEKARPLEAGQYSKEHTRKKKVQSVRDCKMGKRERKQMYDDVPYRIPFVNNGSFSPFLLHSVSLSLSHSLVLFTHSVFIPLTPYPLTLSLTPPFSSSLSFF